MNVDMVRPIVRATIAMLLVLGAIAACLFQEYLQISPEALTVLASMASGATAFYFGEIQGKKNGE